jgi:hypothetical protein
MDGSFPTVTRVDERRGLIDGVGLSHLIELTEAIDGVRGISDRYKLC